MLDSAGMCDQYGVLFEPTCGDGRSTFIARWELTGCLIRFASDKNCDFRILKAVETVNAYQKGRLFARIKKHFNSIRGKT